MDWAWTEIDRRIDIVLLGHGHVQTPAETVVYGQAGCDLIVILGISVEGAGYAIVH